MNGNGYRILEVSAKPWWRSKVMVWNLVTLVVVALGLILDNATALGVEDKVKIWIGIVIAVLNATGNLYLRPGSVQPVALTRGQTREIIARPVEPPAAIDPPRWRDL